MTTILRKKFYLLFGELLFLHSFDSEQPNSPSIDEFDGSLDAWSEADSEPHSKENTECEWRPKHSSKFFVFSDHFELLRRLMVEEYRPTSKAEKREKYSHASEKRNDAKNILKNLFA
jgi:hypothetical protein